MKKNLVPKLTSFFTKSSNDCESKANTSSSISTDICDITNCSFQTTFLTSEELVADEFSQNIKEVNIDQEECTEINSENISKCLGKEYPTNKVIFPSNLNTEQKNFILKFGPCQPHISERSRWSK